MKDSLVEEEKVGDITVAKSEDDPELYTRKHACLRRPL